MTKTLVIDGLEFLLRRSSLRKTLQLTVDRGGEVILTAPERLGLDDITDFAREKRLWVCMKLAQKGRLSHASARKEFVSGETFYYLGRGYRLLLVSNTQDSGSPLRLHRGRFLLLRGAAGQADGLSRRWYLEHARPYILAKAEYFSNRMGVKPTSIQVIDLGFRWGSCSSNGRISLHWQIAQLPPRMVEYVVVHELAHLVRSGHDKTFWHRIERVLPDYEERKSWLAENGSRYSWDVAKTMKNTL